MKTISVASSSRTKIQLRCIVDFVVCSLTLSRLNSSESNMLLLNYDHSIICERLSKFEAQCVSATSSNLTSFVLVACCRCEGLSRREYGYCHLLVERVEDSRGIAGERDAADGRHFVRETNRQKTELLSFNVNIYSVNIRVWNAKTTKPTRSSSIPNHIVFPKNTFPF